MIYTALIHGYFYAVWLGRHSVFLQLKRFRARAFTAVHIHTWLRWKCKRSVDCRAPDRSGFEARGLHSFTKWWLKVSSARRVGEGGQVMREEVNGWRWMEGNVPQRGERLVSHSKTSQQPIKSACKCAVQWTMTDFVGRTFTTHTTHTYRNTHSFFKACWQLN